METTTNTALVAIKKNEKPILENLMQFYFYDFTEFNGADVTETGMYGEYPFIDNYWEEENRYPFFIYHQGKIAGFALVSKCNRENQIYYEISEFFIFKKYRKLGVGKSAAKTIFESFKGNWEVLQILSNTPAQRFWRKVIHEFTNGQYSEKTNEKSIVQLFVS